MSWASRHHRKCFLKSCGKENDSNLSSFAFPKDKARTAVWCKNLGVEATTLKDSSRICANHFSSDQFVSKKKMRLRGNAVPMDGTSRSTLANIGSSTQTYTITTNVCHTNVLGPHNAQMKQPATPTATQLETCRPVQQLASQTPRISIPTIPPTTKSTFQSQIGTLQNQTPALDTQSSNMTQSNSVFSNAGALTVDHSYCKPKPALTPSPVRKNRLLKKKYRTACMVNYRMKRKLPFTQSSTDEKLTFMFGSDKSFLDLIKAQAKRFIGKKRAFYTDEEKALSFATYYNCGRKGYKFLTQLGWKLPCLSSLRKWLMKLELRPGINEALLNCVKDKIQVMNTFEKDCILLWDEMRIKQLLMYDKSRDELVGIVDHGNGERELEPAKEALVILIKGLNSNWAFPISYYFSSDATESLELNRLVTNCIQEVQKLGVSIKVAMCDMSFTNQGLFRIHGITEYKPYIDTDTGRIYLLFDPCHLIKLVRTHLERHGFLHDTGVAVWKHITEFYNIDIGTENRLAPKLTRSHIELTDLSRMKVSLATQVLSHSVGAGIMSLVEANLMPPEAAATAHFLKIMNDMFDLLNISTDKDLKNDLKSGRSIFRNKLKLLQIMDFVKTWKCADRAKLPDCVRGLILTLKGMYMLITDLELEGYHYILTRKIQQDSLEHYFGHQRGMGGNFTNPTCQQFRVNFKTLLISRLLKNREGSNCEFNECDNLFQLSYQKLLTFLNGITSVLPTNVNQAEEEEEENTDLDISQLNNDYLI